MTILIHSSMFSLIEIVYREIGLSSGYPAHCERVIFGILSPKLPRSSILYFKYHSLLHCHAAVIFYIPTFPALSRCKRLELKNIKKANLKCHQPLTNGVHS
jgi:hypothetical protein